MCEIDVISHKRTLGIRYAIAYMKSFSSACMHADIIAFAYITINGIADAERVS